MWEINNGGLQKPVAKDDHQRTLSEVPSSSWNPALNNSTTFQSGMLLLMRQQNIPGKPSRKV